MIVVAITAAVDASGTLNTFYVCDGRFVSSPTDTPPNTFFEGSLIEPGSIGISTFGDGRTGGSTKLEAGEVILDNTDDKYDDWINYSFDGRPIIIYSGDDDGAFPASFTKIFTGTMESVSADFDQIIVKMRDKQYIFSTPLLKNKYLGNNVAPNGIEGTADDIKSKVKPKVFGRVALLPCIPVNTSKLVYQLHDGPITSCGGVNDRGAALTFSADYANSALLLAASPPAATFSTCLAEGLIRLGSSPSGLVTAQVTQGVAADQTAAQVVKQIALAAGLTLGEISSSDIASMDAANSSSVGIYVSEETSAQECIDEILNSVGAYCAFDSSGILRMGILTAPSGTPVLTLSEYDIHEGIERKTPRDNGIPLWRVTINCRKNYVVQTTDIADSVVPANRAFLENEYRSSTAEDAIIKNQYLLAGDTNFNTLLNAESYALTEATRLLNLYKVVRSIYDISIQLELFTSNNLRITDVITVDVPRFGLQGKLLRIIGYRIEVKTNKVILQCWG